MGATVIKVEPPGGETYRRMYDALMGDGAVHPSYQFDNRGKRGMCINLEDPAGIDVVHRLVSESDIFITNLTAERLARYRLTDADVHAIKPSMIYGVLSGFGTTGPIAIARRSIKPPSGRARARCRSSAIATTGH